MLPLRKNPFVMMPSPPPPRLTTTCFHVHDMVDAPTPHPNAFDVHGRPHGCTGGGGGPTTPGPNATPPPAICQNLGRGGGARGGQLQPVRMRHPPSYLSKLAGGGGGARGGNYNRSGCDTPPAICQNLRGGGAGGLVGGGRLEGVGGGVLLGGGGSQSGGAYARPTTTKCIPPGGMCVWGGFGEAAGGCCEAGAADGQVCPQIGRCVHRLAGVSTVVVVIFTSQQPRFV